MYLFLCIVSFISVFPLYWMVSAATNKSAEVISGRLIPGTYFMENLRNLLATQNVGRAFGNSFMASKYKTEGLQENSTLLRDQIAILKDQVEGLKKQLADKDELIALYKERR